MSGSLNGTLPPSVQLAATVMPDLVMRHAQDSGYAMPKEGGALTNETRTLIYLGVALATGSHACIDAMMNKAQAQDIDEAKISRPSSRPLRRSHPGLRQRRTRLRHARQVAERRCTSRS